jgi:flagellar motor switch protein FliN/FliY
MNDHSRGEEPQAQPIDYPTAYAHTPAGAPVVKNINPIYAVRAMLQVCIGGVELPVGDLMQARVGAVFALDRMVDQPVDLVLEGSVVARGELVAVDDYFGIRITELPLDLRTWT